MEDIPNNDSRVHYERTMCVGASEYADIIEHLNRLGLPTEFTQTGGMNAALMVRLETGQVLLITDQDDSLAWTRLEHFGWGVGLFRTDDASDGALCFEATEDSSVEALVNVVKRVLLPGS